MELGPLYRQHHAFVWQTLRCLGVGDSAVDDAVQDVFVVVYRRLDDFEGRSSVRTWLYGIARRVAWKYRTRAQRDDTRMSILREVQDDADLEAATDRQRALEIFQAFLEQLDDDRREAFVLAEVAGLRAPEIARALDVNLNTIYSRLRSARSELDRTVSRMRARDGASLVRDVKRQRPDAERAQQGWAGLVATLGLPSVGTAVGLFGSGVTGASLGWTAAIVLGAGLLGATISTATHQGSDPDVAASLEEPPSDPARARAGTADPSAPILESPRADQNRRTADEASSTPSDAAASAQGSEEGQGKAGDSSSLNTEVASAQGGKEGQGEGSSSLNTEVASAHGGKEGQGKAGDASSLNAEVEHVLGIRTAVEGGQELRANKAIERYRSRYPEGALRVEVEALAVELQCRARPDDALQLRDAFLRRWPDAGLDARLTSLCQRRG